MTVALRIGLAIGGAIDLYVAILAIFFPQAIPTALDIPTTDALALLFGGGEYVVAAAIYVLVFRDPERLRPLLWLCVIDQAFAVVLPSVTIARGEVPATLKTVAPIPFQFALAALFAAGALRRPTRA